MAGEKCQVCGGRVVNGRCSLCGMPYRNDEILYHLNEPRDVHYRHASAKVRDMMRQYGQTVDKAAQRGGRVNRSTNMGRNTNAGQNRNTGRNMNTGRNAGANRNPNGNRNTGNAAATVRKTVPAGNTMNKTTADRNRTEVSNQGKKQQNEGRKRNSISWIIWLIVALVALFPQLWDFIVEWIRMNL